MRKKSAAETIRFLIPDERDRFFAAVRRSKLNTAERDYALFLIAYRHALRASEVGLLQAHEVDFKSSKIYIHRLKDSEPGLHWLQPDEAKTLKAYIKHRSNDSPIVFLSRNSNPIDRTTLHKLMRYYGALAKLPEDKQHFHVLKHTNALDLLEASAGDVLFVKDWHGHKNIQSTMRYLTLLSRTRDDKARKYFLKFKRR